MFQTKTKVHFKPVVRKKARAAHGRLPRTFLCPISPIASVVAEQLHKSQGVVNVSKDLLNIFELYMACMEGFGNSAPCGNRSAPGVHRGHLPVPSVSLPNQDSWPQSQVLVWLQLEWILCCEGRELESDHPLWFGWIWSQKLRSWKLLMVVQLPQTTGWFVVSLLIPALGNLHYMEAFLKWGYPQNPPDIVNFSGISTII